MSERVEHRDYDWRSRHFDTRKVVFAMELSFSEKEGETFRTLDKWQADNSIFSGWGQT
jgi:hypothetical protein